MNAEIEEGQNANGNDQAAYDESQKAIGATT